VILGFELNDESGQRFDGTVCDSTYLKQRFTLMSADQILAYYNGGVDKSPEFNWFYNFQLARGTSSYNVFSHNIANLVQFRNEIQRSNNYLQQHSKGLNWCYSSL